MDEKMKALGVDVDIRRLVPLNERKVNFRTNNGYRKILASIKEIGLIEPLCVYQEDGLYVILDGFVRYLACRELGVDKLPCMVYPDKEAYTFNRMVNRLSYTQQARMLRKSLETLDEPTIAKVFGMRRIRYKLGTDVIKRLHPDVVKALDKDLIGRGCAREFTYVKPERQLQILNEMNRTSDYGVSFARALVLRTPVSLRNRSKRRKTPWDKSPAKKRELVTKLEAIEKRYDFYTGLYRQYTTDLLKLCIYVRKLVSNDRIRAHLEAKARETLQRFESILFETQGSALEESGPPDTGHPHPAPQPSDA